MSGETVLGQGRSGLLRRNGTRSERGQIVRGLRHAQVAVQVVQVVSSAYGRGINSIYILASVTHFLFD